MIFSWKAVSSGTIQIATFLVVYVHLLSVEAELNTN
jgi:hypothetical protein